MESSIVKKAKEVLKEKKVRRRWMAVVAVLAVAVVGATAWSLMSPARAMIELYCDLEEHVHSDECYELVLSCGHEEEETVAAAPVDSESEDHQHDDGCYDYVKGTDPVCAQEETEGHTHTDACYTVTEERNLSCDQDGVEGHEHTDECYTVTEVESLSCDQEETEGHNHSDDCYETVETLVCEKEESEGTEEPQEASAEITEAHVHTDECYEQKLICGMEEHEHTEECYKVPVYYCVDRIHSHTEVCYEEGILICGQADFAVHTHNEDCFDLKGNVICPLGEAEEHEHTDECYDQDKNLICGKEEILLHTHSDECRDEKGGLICGRPEILAHVHSEECTVEIVEEPKAAEGGTITKVYEGFAITAVYGSEANLPGDVRLVAEQITAEMDAEHYAAREAEYQAEAGEDAVMHALLKVGFYVNGREVEPEGTVTITVQFLDENGLPEGSPVTVVHFGKNGTEVLNGTDAESSSTTFEMNSFSEIAIGYGTKDAGQEEGTVYISETYEYEDDAFHIDFHVEGTVTVPAAGDKEEQDVAEGETTEQPAEEPEDSNAEAENGAENIESELEFEVVPLNANSNTFAEAAETAEQTAGLTGENELVGAYALTYSLNYNGVKLDLSECQVMAEITPVLTEEEPTEKTDVEADSEESPSDEIITETQYIFVGVSDTKGANLLDTMYMSESNTVVLDVSDSPTVVAYEYQYKIGQVNPKFSVQYYAWIDTMKRSTGNDTLFTTYTEYEDKIKAGKVPIINTHAISNSDGTHLPKNGTGTGSSANMPVMELTIGSDGTFESETKLTRVYASREFNYLSAPNLNYMNALFENQHYVLAEIWVTDNQTLVSDDVAKNVTEDEYKYGQSKSLAESKGWTVYSDPENVRFTNGSSTTIAGKQYVQILDDTIIRLVYNVSNEMKNADVAFYDYDITDGYIYKNSADALAQENGHPTSHQTNTADWYVNTNQKGINSPGNYNGSGTKLAFGNSMAHHGSTYGDAKWNGNYVNRHNNSDGGNGFLGCTFGLVTGLQNGKIQYAAGISAPNLFNDGAATGKTSYDNEYSLQFDRKGDTYTLHAVAKQDGTIVTQQEGLERFNQPTRVSGDLNSKTHGHIWTNNFWPMDSAASYGTDGHDFKFGSNQYLGYRYWASKDSDDKLITSTNNQSGRAPGVSAVKSNQFVVSDDGLDHNSYFGMYYQIKFTLCADYIGPLEYYFFGDDDMWVFLDNQLICDIGGTHSSVGEYVDLWDYVANDWQALQNTWISWTPEEKVANEVPTKDYILSFYYTERGDAGSTCWMQFTLPQVTSMITSANSSDYGDLEVRKVVTTSDDNFIPKEEDFVFLISLKDVSGNALTDNYSYIKYKSDGTLVADLIVNNQANAFTLKDGEYIVIKNLPVGTQYEISEMGVAEYNDDMTAFNSVNSRYDYLTDAYITANYELNKDDQEWENRESNKTVEGTIEADPETEETDEAEESIKNIVIFNNKLNAYRLPKTGSSGAVFCTILGSLCILIAAILACGRNRKLLKTFMGAFLAAAMCFGMSQAVSAAESEGSVAGLVPGVAKQHTYEIYQLFTGDYSNGMLAGVKYGQSITGKAGQTVERNILEQLNALYEQYKDNANEKVQEITKLAGFVEETSDGVEVSKPLGLQPTVSADGKNITYTGLPTGYYLVKDKNNSLNSALGEAYTLYIIRLIDGADGTLEFDLSNGKLEAEPKSAVPTVEKHIMEGAEKVDINNVSIGDSVKYEIKGTLPDNFEDYNTYYYEFTDKLTKGLTYNDDVKVTIGGMDVTKYFYVDHKSDVVVDSDGDTIITIAIDDLKPLKNVGVNVTADSEIIVTYSATLNKNAVIAGEGNPNYVMLNYSNDPNHSGEGRDTPPENPDKPTPDPTRPIGKTPIYEVRTFTTQLTIKKVDGTHENASLAGAEFTLTGKGVNVVLESGTFYTESNEGTFYRLKDGTYTEVSPETEGTEKNDYVQEDDGSYKKYNETVFGGLKEEELDADDFSKDGDKERVIAAVTNEDGVVSFSGLGEGKYTIIETKTPEGYNAIDPIEFTITFSDTSANGVLSGKFDVTEVSDNAERSTVNGIIVSEGVLNVTIKNYLGTLLPSTGGMGTKIFYVGGGILVAAAVVLLVMKNRKSIKKEEE